MSVDDITNLAIPAAVYVSKDESEEEVSNMPDFVLDLLRDANKYTFPV